jgi:SAM-dependent methyltransferase
VADRSRADRDRLKVTFDTVADRYHQVRPAYPDELFAELVCAAGLGPDARLLEVGSGTGKATRPLAARGFAITCLEPGPHLAAVARRGLADCRDVQIVEQAFEDWQPADTERFDLVFAATAWHWIDPAVGYQLAWQRLRPGGNLAIWAAGHVLPADGDMFFREIQDVYDEVGEGLPAGANFPVPGKLPTMRGAIEGSGLFAVTVAAQFVWELRYTAEEYISLLDTFSGHIDMAQWQRDRIYAEIRRRLAARQDGTLRRHWGAVLHVARRLDAPVMSRPEVRHVQRRR